MQRHPKLEIQDKQVSIPTVNEAMSAQVIVSTCSDTRPCMINNSLIKLSRTCFSVTACQGMPQYPCQLYSKTFESLIGDKFNTFKVFFYRITKVSRYNYFEMPKPLTCICICHKCSFYLIVVTK